MTNDLTRRGLVAGAASLAAASVAGGAWAQEAGAAAQIAALEAQLGGRIGFSAMDTGSGRRIQHRSGERFAMCSTFKAALAAAVLQRIDSGALDRLAMLPFGRGDLLGTSRVTTALADQGAINVMTACEAAVTYSDNTAANLLLDLIGGPPAVTDFFRSLGDEVSRLDRRETALNENAEGDVRDTTTPDAMLYDLHNLLLQEEVLADPSRAMLTVWMLTEQNGGARLRAGLPPGWRVANKPGTSTNGAVNDIAVAWPPGRPPVVFAAYLNAPGADFAQVQAAIAQAAALAAREFGLV